MAIANIFSKRKKRERGEMTDIFIYNEIPTPLRVQIIHIWTEAFGLNEYQHGPNDAFEYFKTIHDLLSKEYGVFNLIAANSQNIGHFLNSSRQNYEEVLRNFFLSCNEIEKILDVIEFVCRVFEIKSEKSYPQEAARYNEALTEINLRFVEHGVGYQFESGQIIRKDSELFHQKTVKPVLNFLNTTEYTGANEEFLKAHEHYRHRRYKECLNECLKSFESVMKIICDKHNWAYSQNDTAKKLIEICFANDLVPSYLQSQFSALKAVLESGIPTARNKTSGHGQGITQAVVTDYFARYVLNLTATTILFLVEAEKELP